MSQCMVASSFVLDNSVLCGWFLANQASEYGDAVAAGVGVLAR